MLSTRVILLNVTNLSDARYAAGMGVDYIGFSINPASNHYVTSEDVNTITNWLSGVSLIGNVGSSAAEFQDYKIDYLMTDNTELVNQLDEPILYLSLSAGNAEEIEQLLANNLKETSFYILKVDVEEIEDLGPVISDFNSSYKCYITTDFNEASLKKILETKPQGIVLFGSHEEKPGLSNYDGIADVLELLDE